MVIMISAAHARKLNDLNISSWSWAASVAAAVWRAFVMKGAQMNVSHNMVLSNST
jgi:predicted benzoate:H+ symporter BenE